MEQKFGYVVGYRSWEMLYPGVIINVNGHTLWEPGKKLEAGCTRGLEHPGSGHSAPSETCTCGIYAFRNQNLSVEGLTNNTSQIYGKVALWGKVLRYSRGYRTQFAYPLEFYFSLANSNHSKNLFQVIAEKYEVPLIDATFMVTEYEVKQRIEAEKEARQVKERAAQTKETWYREHLERGKTTRRELAEWKAAPCPRCGQRFGVHVLADHSPDTICPGGGYE